MTRPDDPVLVVEDQLHAKADERGRELSQR